MTQQALIVVDVQQGFEDPKWGPRNNPACESNIAALVTGWEAAGQPVVIVRHASTEPNSPLRPDRPGFQLKAFLAGRGDLQLTKSVHSCFHGDPDLHAWLTERGVRSVLICGITTNHCCETTARVACDLGYDVTFILDATHTFDRQARNGEIIPADLLAELTATNLSQEFAQISDTSAVLASAQASVVSRSGS